MIIAVGFKINNERAIQFIKWANKNGKNINSTEDYLRWKCINGIK